MREVEAHVVVALNPEDAATHPDGTFGGLPVVADPAIPPGFASFRYALPPGVEFQSSEPWTFTGEMPSPR